MLTVKLAIFITLGLLLSLFGRAHSKKYYWREVKTGAIGGPYGVAMSPNGQHIVLSHDSYLHSSDGGRTWEGIDGAPEIMAFGSNAHVFGVGSGQGCNLSNGYAAMFRSTDYFRTRIETPVATPMCFGDVFFLGSLHGWAVGSWKDSIVITRDGGKTVFTRSFGLPLDEFGRVRFAADGVNFLDTLNGYVACWLPGTDSAVLRTTDGGNTWTALTLGIAPSWLAAWYVKFTDSRHGWVFGGNYSGRYIFTSSDGGLTWTQRLMPPYTEVTKVCAIDSLRCWMVGGACPPCGPRIWKTSDGGQSWIVEYAGPRGTEDIDIVDTAHGVVISRWSSVVLIYSPIILGDLNGDEQITPADVVLELLKIFVGQITIAPDEAGDVNCDGFLTSVDMKLLIDRTFLETPFSCSI